MKNFENRDLDRTDAIWFELIYSKITIILYNIKKSIYFVLVLSNKLMFYYDMIHINQLIERSVHSLLLLLSCC